MQKERDEDLRATDRPVPTRRRTAAADIVGIRTMGTEGRRETVVPVVAGIPGDGRDRGCNRMAGRMGRRSGRNRICRRVLPAQLARTGDDRRVLPATPPRPDEPHRRLQLAGLHAQRVDHDALAVARACAGTFCEILRGRLRRTAGAEGNAVLDRAGRLRAGIHPRSAVWHIDRNRRAGDASEHGLAPCAGTGLLGPGLYRSGLVLPAAHPQALARTRRRTVSDLPDSWSTASDTW